MRRWRAAAATALSTVADRPALWLAGGLAWVATVGWIPFAIAVVRPPTVAELTYFGTRFWTSGLWPLNLVLVAAGLVAVAVLLLAAAALGNAMLLAAAAAAAAAAGDRRIGPSDVGRLLVPGLVASAPVAVGMLAVLVATIAVGPAEFNRPQAEPGPVARTVLRLAPLLIFTGAVAVVASTLAGLAGRAALRAGHIADGLAAVPGMVRRGGRAGLLHLAASIASGITYLVLVTLLLGVLWAPIRVYLEGGGGIDLAGVALLVGFVAIWLCLVLAGGALHAWASLTASQLLERRSLAGSSRMQESPIDR